jgi:hypothetical protein
MEKTHNRKILADFTAYCLQHPELRFWQALAGWSKYLILASKEDCQLRDTFYWEGRDGNED